MSRIASIAVVTALLSAPAAVATDFELEVGIRSFGSDNERWPQVSGSVLFGSERWRIRPIVGGAWAEEPLYAGRVTEARAGVGFVIARSGRSAWSGGIGAARLDYDFGANHGGGEAGYVELGWLWDRSDAVDLGASLRVLEGSDVELESRDFGSPDGTFSFREPVSTVSASFVVRW